MQRLDCDFEAIHGEKEAELAQVAQAPTPSAEQRILNLLREELSGPAAMAVFDEIEELASDLSIELAANAVRSILEAVGNTAAGRALKIAVCGRENNWRTEAAEVKTDHASLIARTKRIGGKLKNSTTKR